MIIITLFPDIITDFRSESSRFTFKSTQIRKKLTMHTCHGLILPYNISGNTIAVANTELVSLVPYITTMQNEL